MLVNRKLFALPTIIILALAGLLLFYTPVHAEGDLPPAETPAAETQVVDETAPAQPDAADEVAPEGSGDEGAAPAEDGAPQVPEDNASVGAAVEVSPTAVEPTIPDMSGDEPDGETLPDQPADMLEATEPAAPELVVVDSAGEPLPLASTEAVDALSNPDPYFYVGSVKYSFMSSCAGVTGNCITSATPIQAAFDYIRDNGLSPTGGAVYVEEGDYTENVFIDGLAVDSVSGALKWRVIPSTLALIGVKIAVPGSIPEKTIANVGDVTLKGSLTVNNIKSFTLQAFEVTTSLATSHPIVIFSGNTGTINLIDVDVRNTGTGIGLVVDNQSGAVNLTRVNSSRNGEIGAVLNNSKGAALPITVKNSAFDQNGGYGLYIVSKGAVTLSGVSASDNSTGYGAYVSSVGLTVNQSVFNHNGTQGLRVVRYTVGGPVSIQNSQFNENGYEGADIKVNGNVDIKNVRANQNGWAGFFIDTCNLDSGTSKCLNPLAGAVTISQAIVTNNVKSGTNASGVFVRAKGIITLTNVYSGGNGDDSHTAWGAVLNNAGALAPVAVNITGSTFNNNNVDGLNVYSRGIITLKDTSAMTNGGNGALLVNDYDGFIPGVSVLNSVDAVNTFNDNHENGLEVHSNGAVILNSVRADTNLTGVYVDNSGGTGAVTIDGVSGTTVSKNTADGIYVVSKGLITVKNLDVTDNHLYGLNLNNTAGIAGVTVTATLPRWYNGIQNNWQNGISIRTNGPVTIAKTKANNNGNYGAYINSTDGGNGSGDVTITDSQFNHNASATELVKDTKEYGLFVRSHGSINLTLVDATNNGFYEDDEHTQIGRGAILNNTLASAAKPVTITKANFRDNNGDGLIVTSLGAISYKTGSLGNNNGKAVSLDNSTAAANQTVTVGLLDIWGAHLSTSGLTVLSKGNITVTETSVSQTKGTGISLDNHLGTGTVTISGTPAWFRYIGENDGAGVTINTNGAVTMSYLSINSNGAGGVSVETNGPAASVTLSGMDFYGNTSFGLDVSALGNISLDNIQVADTVGGHGVHLNNCRFDDDLSLCTGTGTVTVKSAYGKEIRNNGGYGLFVESKGNIALTNIEIRDNTGFGAHLDNSNGTTGTVTINNTMYRSYKSNGGAGLEIDTPGLVLINLVDATHNNGTNVDINNTYGPTTAVPPVTITNSWFNESQNGSGLVVTSRGAITLTYVDATDNAFYGANLSNGGDYGKGGVTITGAAADEKKSFSNNNWGLTIVSNGAVTIKFMDVSNNEGFGADINNSGAATPQAVAITSSDFNNNSLSLDGFGLSVLSKGNITIIEGGFHSNGDWDKDISANGLVLDNCLLNVDDLCRGSGFVSLLNTGAWDNTGNGMDIKSFGAITLTDISAGWNGGNGATFANNFTKANPKPTLLQPTLPSVAGVTLSLPAGYSNTWGTFINNGGYGLSITSNGAVAVSNVNVNTNGGSIAAAYIDNSTAATPMAVTISKSKFNDNNSVRGIQVLSKGAITFSNNEVSNNRVPGEDGDVTRGGAELDNHTSTLAQNVTVISSKFDNTQGGNGLLVTTKGNVLLTNVSAVGNANDGLRVDATAGNGTITMNGAMNEFYVNGEIGANLMAKGNVSVTNIKSDFNAARGMDIHTNYDGGTGTATVTNAIFEHNGGDGILASTNGAITLTNITSLRNGADIDGDGADLTANNKDIIITNSSFMGNYGSGIQSSTGALNTLKLVETYYLGNDINHHDHPNITRTGKISII